MLSESAVPAADDINGIAVLRYRYVGDDETVHEIAFAPGRGCEIVEDFTQWKGTLGIPGARYRMRVTQYEPGEPEQSQFALPSGYRVELERPRR